MVKNKTNPMIVILIIGAIVLLSMNSDKFREEREVPAGPVQCSMIASSGTSKINEKVSIDIYDGKDEFCNVMFRLNNGRWEDERVLRLDETGHYQFEVEKEFAGTYDYKAHCDGGCDVEYITIEVTQ
jgi:hypothetical protein